MHKWSHDKKHLPKGFPFENDAESIKKSSLVCSTDVHVPKVQSEKVRNHTQARQRAYIIRSAYAEPLGYDMVENMLLQRDYIID